MKHKLLAFLLALFALNAAAIPAFDEPFTVTNPDGTSVTVVLHGDEYYDFKTTIDGYTVVKNSAGYYVYATNRGGRLAPTAIVAHDMAARTTDEQTFLASTSKRLMDVEKVSSAKKMRSQRDNGLKVKPLAAAGSNFKGLVILVEFTGRQFEVPDPHSFFSGMMNTDNYTGYPATGVPIFDKYSNFTGSVRDYFVDNTMGVFRPTFDVVGPVTINASCVQSDHTKDFRRLFSELVVSLNSQIDYSQYDSDGDGVVDLIYFVCAGFGSNYGNDSGYLWPHASIVYDHSTMTYLNMDGVYLNRYACSVEMYGKEEVNGYIPDGIGVICHEFSHVLGVKDLYDTDYETDGQSLHPGKWDLMASGGYLNFSRTPCGYSLYDRYCMGFANPTVISGSGTYSLNPIGDSNEGYIILTPNSQEKFLLENRQLTSKWDAYLPGHGMLVARMDSVDADLWDSNKINANASRNYYELLRAGLSTEGNSDSDPFPGTSNNISLAGDDSTNPNLKTWDGQTNDISLVDIAENNGVISFTVPSDVMQAPISICGHALSSDMDMDEFLNTLVNEGYVKRNKLLGLPDAVIDYNYQTNTLTIGGEINDANNSITIAYNPQVSNIPNLNDTLHLVVAGTTVINNSKRGGIAMAIRGHVLVEGSESIIFGAGGQLGIGIYLMEGGIELNGKADVNVKARNYAVMASGTKNGRVIARDGDFASPPKFKFTGTVGTFNALNELVTDNGYYISSHPGASLNPTTGRLVDASGTVIKAETVVIEQGRTPILLNGSPIYKQWTETDWANINNAFRQTGAMTGNGFSYDHSNRTLTIDNVVFNSSNAIPYVIANGYPDETHSTYVNGYSNFKINVIGDCEIITGEKVQAIPFMSYNGNTTFIGDGTLKLIDKGESYAIRTRGTNAVINLDGPNIIAVVTDNNVALRGTQGTLNINAGSLTATALRGIPFAQWTAINIADGLGIIQPQGGYLAADGNTGIVVFNADGSSFGGATLIIGRLGFERGDVNEDGFINAGDVSTLYAVILGSDLTFERNANLNGDNAINAGDISTLYELILK